MKRKTINKQIYDKLPRHKNAGQVGAMDYATGALGMLSNVYGNLNQPYNYQPQFKQSTINGVGYQEEQLVDTKGADNIDASSVLSGASSGASLGTAIMPGVGTAIGAGVGALASGISSYFGGKSKKNAMEEENKKIKARNTFKAAGAHTQGLQNEWNMNGVENNMQYLANGGKVFNPNARVDEGEVMQEPNGNMETVENSNPNVQQVQPNTTDGYVANLKEGTRILSNKIRIPGSKQTFAEAGQKIESKLNAMKKREPKSQIEANTARLNESNLQKQYNDLFEAQEAVKGFKMRPEGSYKDGGEAQINVGRTHIQYPMKKAPGINLVKNGYMQIPTAVAKGMHIGNMTAGIFGAVGDLVHLYNDVKDTEALQNSIKRGGKSGIDAVKELRDKYKYNPENMPTITWSKGGQVSDGYQAIQYSNLPEFNKGVEYYTGLGNAIQKGLSHNSDIYNDDLILGQHKLSYGTNTTNVMNSIAQAGDKPSTLKDDMFNLAPSLMNIANSFDSTYKAQNITPESMVSDNPYEGQVLSALKKRRARIQPLLDQNNMNSTIARYNARMQGTGGRAYDVATTAGKMRADQDAITSTNKINDSYLTDYANTLNQFGQQKASQMANAKQYASQYNANQLQQQYQSEGARKGLMQAGLKGVSDYYQMKNTTATKNKYDNAMLGIMSKQASRWSIDDENSYKQWLKSRGLD